MIKNYLNIRKFNNEIAEELTNNSMNFAKCLLPDEGKNLSIVATYSPVQEYITLNSELEIIESKNIDNYYYGISPEFGAKRIIDIVSSLSCSNEPNFIRCLKENATMFSLHSTQTNYLLSFAKSAILTAINIYCIVIDYSKNHDFKVFCENKENNINCIIIDDKNSHILIKGGILDSEIETFNKYFDFCKIDGVIYPIKKNTQKAICSLEELFKDKTNIVTTNDKVFYSGVLLKANKIDISGSANLDIQPLNIHFERTTFLTVKVFTKPVLNHTYLKNENLSELLKDDDKLAKDLSDNLLNNDNNLNEYCKNINIYLEKTCSVNQIGISGNLITKDGYLLLGLRAKDACDADEYYPGVNGNAEVKDKRVDFYLDSVNEDYPDINIYDDRIDFFGELDRETYAELGIRTDSMLWKCKGLALVGNVNKNEYSGAYERRMHFNVICEQNIDVDFIEVLKKNKESSESYENQDIVGLKYKSNKSLLDKWCVNLYKFLLFLAEIKDIVLFAVSLSILIIYLKEKGSTITVDSGVSIFFSIVVSIITIVNLTRRLLNYINKRKYSSVEKTIVKNNKDDNERTTKNNDIMYKYFGINEEKTNATKFHPTTLIALKLYLDERFINTNSIKDIIKEKKRNKKTSK